MNSCSASTVAAPVAAGWFSTGCSNSPSLTTPCATGTSSQPSDPGRRHPRLRGRAAIRPPWSDIQRTGRGGAPVKWRARNALFRKGQLLIPRWRWAGVALYRPNSRSIRSSPIDITSPASAMSAPFSERSFTDGFHRALGRGADAERPRSGYPYHETIDDRIGETVKRKPTTVAPGRDSKAGIRIKKSRDAFELVQKPLGNTTPGFSPVKAGCLTQGRAPRLGVA
jgi:hypothetical protein